MNRIFFVFYLGVLFLLFPGEMYAVKAISESFIVHQPNGDTLRVCLHGDEFFHYITTDDGILIAQSSDKFYKYARMSATGQIEPTKINANNPRSRSVSDIQLISSLQKTSEFSTIAQAQTVKKVATNNEDVIKKTYPLSGSPKTLVILVNFSDKSFSVSTPQTAFTNLLNEDGYSTNGGTGSAKDYFEDASNNAFSPQFDVVGPYTLPSTLAYYGANNSSGDDAYPRQMVIDACSLADQNGVDFTQYDTDNDGMVDNIFIYYAGYNEAEGAAANTIWPHRWTLANYSTKFDGKIIFDYACTSELRGTSGTNMCGIGTFCHEFGHVLGLPDLYATNSATHHTLYSWDIMDYGPYNNNGRTPPTYSAYERFFLGWLTPVELKTAQNVTLYSISQSNKAYLISQTGSHNLNGQSPSPSEFILLENRQKTGWDTYLPGHGMLVTRVNYNSSTWSYNTVNNTSTAMGVDIIEADGIATDASCSGDPFPGIKSVTSYDPTLTSGTVLNKPLTSITENSGTISFKFMGGGDLPVITATSDFSQFSTVQGTPSDYQTVVVSGKNLSENIVVSFTDNTNFEVKKDTDPESSWGKSLTLSPVDSAVSETNVLIRYNPVEPSFSAIHNDTIDLSSSGAESVQIAIKGQSTRPVYVVPPVATDATDVTLANFTANWGAVYDATGYYVTVYSVSDGNSEFVEAFDDGLTAPTDWTINATKTNTSSVYSGTSAPSILLQKTGEYIETQKYVQNPNGLSFFSKSVAGTGSLIVEGWDSANWQSIDSIVVSTTLNGTQSYTFDDNIYERFRLRFNRTSGQISIDDVTASFNTKIEFIYTDEWVEDTSLVVPNLISNRDHYYFVKASDRTLYSDSTLKYENITDNSNVIYVKTLLDTNDKVLRVIPQTDGSLMVITPDTTDLIYVYNVLGQLYKIVTPGDNIVTIANLPTNQIYVLKSGDRRAKVLLK
jgi:M6 family metalloprotease-like protein